MERRKQTMEDQEKRRLRMRIYMRKYQNQKRVKERLSAYWKQPHVRKRIRDRRNSNPAIIAKREARLKWRLERKAYRESDEFKLVLKERNRRNWLKRKSLGKTKELDRKRWQNPQHRLAQNMRRLVHQALCRTKVVKSQRLLELIGCTMPEFKTHLESQFEFGMSWQNMGKWEIDHRVPLSSFNLADPEQQKLAFNFHNCRPLWKQANRQKSDKIEGELFRGRDMKKIIPFKAA